MNRDYSRFDSLTSILAGTVTVAGIVIFAQAPVFAKTPQEIAELANSVSVQINGQSPNRNLVKSGSGFIIAKQGTTYTVLTANHVVENTEPTYTIRTSTGKDYQVTSFVRLQKINNDPDLAVVTFNSTDSYPVVTLGDSQQVAAGTPMFVFGYPDRLENRSGTKRNYEFVPGYVYQSPFISSTRLYLALHCCNYKGNEWRPDI